MKHLRIPTCKTLIALLLALVCYSPVLAEECDTLVVVVSPDNPISDISQERLRRIYLGKVITFTGNIRIQLVESDCCIDFFYKTVLEKTIGQVRKLWLRNIFSGRDCLPPKPFRKSKDLLNQIKTTKGSIGFLPLNEIDDSVKVLSIDGKQPDDSGYLLIPCSDIQEAHHE